MAIRTLSGETITRTDHAYLRISTPQDLHDAIFLAMSGVHIAFEPIPGFLSGFQRPLKLGVVAIKRKGRLFVDRTAASMATAILAIITNKKPRHATPKPDELVTIRDEKIEAAFVGIWKCLNQRAGRPLSRIDIADIMGWITTVTDVRIDAQVPYGSEEWGAFLRREPSLGLGWSPPPVVSNFSRTIVCHVKPKLDDLSRILSHGPVGVINAKGLRAKAPWAHGMSADKRLCLPSHVLAPMISWKAHDAGVEMPTVTRRDLLTAGSPEEAQRALYGAVWDRGREVSVEGFRATLEPVPQPLQAVWHHQRDGHHCYGLDIVGMPPCDPEDLRRHALHAGMKAADAERVPRPLAVTTSKVTTTDPVGTLVAQAQWGKLLTGHNATAEVIFGTDEAAGMVAHLDGSWDSFVGANFSAR